jgi:hypothetical protein
VSCEEGSIMEQVTQAVPIYARIPEIAGSDLGQGQRVLHGFTEPRQENAKGVPGKRHDHDYFSNISNINLYDEDCHLLNATWPL